MQTAATTKFRNTAIVSALALIASLFTLIPTQFAAAQSGTCTFSSGTGVDGDPYQVATLADLQMVRSCHASANGLYFEQTAHIDIATETNWTPIGNATHVFNDNYDGNYFEIRNLTIAATASASTAYYGLFGKVDVYDTSGSSANRDIRAIALTGVNIAVAATNGALIYVGGVAGEAEVSSGTVASGSNTFRVHGTINVTGTPAAGSAVGGGFGVSRVNETRVPSNLMFVGDINSTAEYTGGAIGLVDRLDDFGSYQFFNLNVRGSVAGSAFTGGFFGGLQTQGTPSAFNQFNDGFLDASVQSINETSNGLVGYAQSGEQLVVANSRTVTDAFSGPLSITGINIAQSNLGTILRVNVFNLSWSNWSSEIQYSFPTTLQNLGASFEYRRCDLINDGYPISYRWYLPYFSAGGPCGLDTSVTSATTKFVNGDRSKVVVTLSPWSNPYYEIANTRVSIESDPSSLFSVASTLSSSNEIILQVANDLPAGEYEVKVRFDRDDIPLYSGRAISLSVIGCDFAGSGTTADPYIVDTKERLAMIAKCSSGSTTEFKLTQDLDLQGAVWEPIGTDSEPFTGVLDGAGFTISNLDVSGNINATFSRSGPDGAGLFGRVNQASIKNLTVLGDVTVASSDYTGGIVGRATNSTINNVAFTGQVLSDNDDGRIGGIAGEADAVDFEDVRVDVSIIGNEESNRAGGIVGSLGSASSITNATATGEINLGGDFDDIGGIVGYARSSTISDVLVENFIIRGDDDLGGIAGDANTSTFFDFSVNTVSISGDDRLGGVIGDSESDIGYGAIGALTVAGISTSSSQLGGIVGAMAGGSVTRVSVSGEIRGENNVGGAVGELQIGDASYVAANVDLIAEGNSIAMIGGFVGLQSGGTISDSYVVGTLTDDETAADTDPDPEQIGSFAGEFSDMNGSTGDDYITNSYAAIEILLDEPTTAIESAPFVGNFNPSLDIVASFLLGQDPTSPTCHADPLNCYDVTAADAETLKSLATFDDAGWTIQDGWAQFALLSDDPAPDAEAIWGICSQVNDGLPFLMHQFGEDPCVVAASNPAPAPYTGPLVVNNQQQVTQGESVTITGQRLDQVSAISVAGVEATIEAKAENSITFTISIETALGVTDILLIGTFGNLTLQDALLVVEKETIQAVQEPDGWTKAQPDGTIKIYAKNVVAIGKVQFFQNGKEIAWVRAADETDPKLRRITQGPMAGTNYLVRTITLLPGKNALEIYIEGERIWRAAYTRKD